MFTEKKAIVTYHTCDPFKKFCEMYIALKIGILRTACIYLSGKTKIMLIAQIEQKLFILHCDKCVKIAVLRKQGKTLQNIFIGKIPIKA